MRFRVLRIAKVPMANTSSVPDKAIGAVIHSNATTGISPCAISATLKRIGECIFIKVV